LIGIDFLVDIATSEAAKSLMVLAIVIFIILLVSGVEIRD